MVNKKFLTAIIMMFILLSCEFGNVHAKRKLTPEESKKIHQKIKDKFWQKSLKESEAKSSGELMKEFKEEGYASAAVILLKRKAISMKEVVETKIKVLQNEINHPTISKSKYGIPVSCAVKQGKVVGFEPLGKEALPYVKGSFRGKNKNDEFNQWIIIALGYLKEKSVVNDLLWLSVQSKSPCIREESIMALYDSDLYESVSRQKLVSYMKKWAKDSYFVEYRDDSPPGLQKEYPIRNRALTFRLRLGIDF